MKEFGRIPVPKLGPGRLLRPSQVAEILGVCQATVYRWIDTGILPAVRIGRYWRVDISEVEKLLAGETAVHPEADADTETGL